MLKVIKTKGKPAHNLSDTPKIDETCIYTDKQGYCFALFFV